VVSGLNHEKSFSSTISQKPSIPVGRASSYFQSLGIVKYSVGMDLFIVKNFYAFESEEFLHWEGRPPHMGGTAFKTRF